MENGFLKTLFDPKVMTAAGGIVATIIISWFFISAIKEQTQQFTTTIINIQDKQNEALDKFSTKISTSIDNQTQAYRLLEQRLLK